MGNAPWTRVLGIAFYEEPNVGLDKYRLHFNENLFLPREYYEEVLKALLEPDLVRYYTEPLNTAFNNTIAKHLGVDGTNVFATAGGDEALRLLIQVALHGNRKLLVVEPTYSMPRALAESMGVEVVEVLLRPDYQLDVDAIVRAGLNADVVYICNPNNPTGNLFNRGDIEYIVSRLNSLVIIDEAYAEFAGTTLMDLIKHYDNVAVVRTFSKAWGLAGLRVGYVVAPEIIINALRRLSLPHNIPYPSMAMVTKALQLWHYVRESIERMISVREYMIKRMEEIGITPLRTVTNFVTFHVKDPDTVYKKLEERGFVLRNLKGKPLCQDCLRATVPPLQIAEKLLDALNDITKRLMNSI